MNIWQRIVLGLGIVGMFSTQTLGHVNQTWQAIMFFNIIISTAIVTVFLFFIVSPRQRK